MILTTPSGPLRSDFSEVFSNDDGLVVISIINDSGGAEGTVTSNNIEVIFENNLDNEHPAPLLQLRVEEDEDGFFWTPR